MGKKIKVRRWMKSQLYDKYQKGFGHSKKKGVHNQTPFIHSENTYKTYLAQCDHFADWLIEQGVKDKDEAFKLIPDYLKNLEAKGQSAWSIQTSMCAIAKAYDISTESIPYVAPKRRRADVKRSRGAAERDKHFSIKKNQGLIDFCSSTGLRRHELAALHGNQLAVDYKGEYIIRNVKGKGGKVRDITIIGSPKEIEYVVNTMRAAKEGLVFQSVHSAFDEHYYRSIYACRAYKKVERDIESLENKDLYICRKDKKGVKYDKKALKYASEQLGHHRIDVVALSYLHNL